MPTYEVAPAEAKQRIDQMLTKYHGPLRDAGVSIDCLFAWPKKDKNGDYVGNAVIHGGYACAAKIRIIGLKDRTKGAADAEIIVDALRWDVLDEEERDALIDHELEHLELVTKKGLAQRDDLDRPKLRCIKHDHQFGWFNAVVRRHGVNSLEWQQYSKFACEAEAPLRQLWLPYCTTEVRTGEAPAARDRKSRAVAG